jgi:8-oxo-dGTP pyrophosphatase MutT (NUDIX family)
MQDRNASLAKKQKPKSRKDRLRRQYAALPYRLEGDETEVMLVTSRETHRWILPKGWPEKTLTGPQVAAKEAMEEAGHIGEPADRPVGSYMYHKRLNNGRDVPCGVDVFPLRVERLLDDWPERQQRERRWFTLPQAAMAVEEGELVTLLLRLAAPVA